MRFISIISHYAKFFLLSLFAYMCFSGKTFSQVNFPDCQSNYFRTSFTNPGSNYISDFVILPGGNMIAAGYAQGRYCIVKHDRTGSILASIMLPVVFSSTSIAKMKWAGSNRIFLVNSDGREFYEIDTSCNILNSVTVRDINNLNIGCMDIESLPGGDKIILFIDNGSNYWIARISADLTTFIWCKALDGNAWGAEVNYRNLLVDGNKLFLTGWSSDYFGYEEYGSILQLNLVTGLTERDKRIKLDFPDPEANQLYLRKMVKYDSGYIIKLYFRSSDSIPTTDILGYVRVDTSLNVKSIQSLQHINNTVAQSVEAYELYAEPGGRLYGFHGSGGDNLFHIDEHDVLLWKKRLGPSLSYVAKLSKTNEGFVSIGNSNYTAVGVGDFGSHDILRFTSNGLPACPLYTDYLELRALPYAYLNTVTVVIDSSRFHLENITVVPANTTFSPSTYCSSVSICNSIKVMGDAVHCNNLPGVYLGRRNAGCYIPVNFSVIPSNGVSIQMLTDTTSSIAFANSGNYWVHAEIQSACGIFYDSMMVSVTVAPLPDFGADTTLCPNSTITLHAPPGYMNYQWSDGSFADSLIVNTTGIYYVSVENSCNEIFTDTIQVQPVAFSFSAGTGQLICDGESINLSATAGFVNYEWQPDYNISSTHTANTTVYPNIDTSYIVTAEKWPGCVVRDTIHIQVLNAPPVFLGNDTSLCTGQSVILNAGNGFTGYLWNDGTSSQTLTINSAGTYSVAATASNNCVSRDTFRILQVSPLPVFTLGPDTSYCEHTTYTYNFNLPNAEYLWNDGTNVGQYTISQPGVYWLAVADAGCTARDTVQVGYKPLPLVRLGNDTAFCLGESYLLNASFNGATYLWQDGSSSPQFLVTAAGSYHVESDLSGCLAKDTINISFLEPPYFTFNADNLICEGQTIVLRPSTNTTVDYLWQDGSTTEDYIVSSPGIYTLDTRNICGHFKDSIKITAGACSLIIPNSFSPNGDTYNDIFKVKYPFPVSDFRLAVYNRYGQPLYATNDINKGWDGTFKNKLQPTGTYVWVIQFKTVKNITERHSGNVILLR